MTPDYADWLNPMLVKELRQGLRKSLFVSVFILVQAAMIVIIGSRMLTTSSEMDQVFGGFLDSVLWGGMGLALLIIMPMRGVAAIPEEQKANTLDLVQMTQLGSTGIVFGKWVAIVSQSLLIAVSVLPYAVLRYFFGGVDIVENLVTLAMMVVGSAVATALCLWLSTLPQAMRGVGVGLGVYLIPSLLMGTRMMSSFGISKVSSASGLTLLYGAMMMIWFLLTLAASRIAPAAENHATKIRLIALIGCLVGAVGAATNRVAWVVVTLPIIFWAVFEAMTERTSDVPSVYAPWVKRGRLARVAGRFLYPGWATGIFFAALIFGIQIMGRLLAPHLASSDLRHDVIGSVIMWLAFLTPLVILCFMPGLKLRGGLYFCIQLLLGLMFVLARLAFGGGADVRTATLDACTPTTAALAITGGLNDSDHHWHLFEMITLPVGGCMVLLLLFYVRKEFRVIREMETRSVTDEPTKHIA